MTDGTATAAPPCPHCGGGAVHGYGSFRRKDGTRQKRYLCRSCDRTFHQLTGTPLNYLKKRDRWPLFLDGLVAGWTLRHSAALLGVHLATAFAWRHRLLAHLSLQPQPVLSGSVTASEAFVPYSEKGSRKTFGPGSYGARCAATPGRRPFRRFIDGKPTCVLLACAGKQHAVVPISRGRPGPVQLCLVLKQILGIGSALMAEVTALYAETCRSLGIHLQYPSDAAKGALRFHRTFHPWLRKFCGVATRYLEHYLSWYRLVRIPAATSSQAALLTLVRESHTPGCLVSVS